MKSQELGSFIIFNLLSAALQNRADADSTLTHPRQATANVTPLALLLKATLQRKQTHEPLQASGHSEPGQVFLLRTTE
jgi:hypothetical protein